MTHPLVLIHGFTGGPASWERVRRSLTDARALLAPSLLGHAGGPTGRQVHDFAAEVDRIASLVAERFSCQVHLAGYSMGARIAVGLLVRHPTAVACATLIGAHPGLSSPAERHARAQADERWCALLETQTIEVFAAAWQAQPLFASQGALAPERLDEQHRIRTSHDPAGLSCALRRLGLAQMPCYSEGLKRVQTPVRLLSGALDEKSAALAREMAAQLPNATAVTLPGVGHNPVLECPQVVAATLERGMPA